jgi:hypothetical protein
MKLNPKIYRTLTNPVETQEVNGTTVDIHHMNETNYLARYAGQGQFAVWTSDGHDYKLMIERDYFETLRPLYSPKVNGIWIRFYERAGKVRSDIFFKLIGPVLLLALAAIIVFATVPALKAYQTIVLIVTLGLVLVVNIAQSTLMKRGIEKARVEAVTEIKDEVGLDKFNELIDIQTKFYEEYFKFKEEPVQTEVEQIDTKVEDDLEQKPVETLESKPEEASTKEE